MKPHRRPVKAIVNSSPTASLRSTLKAKCMERIRASRAERHNRGRAGLSSELDPDIRMDAVVESCANSDAASAGMRDIQWLLRREWSTLAAALPPLDPDLALEIEREMMEELREMEALHRMQSNQFLNGMEADDYEAFEAAHTERDIQLHLGSHETKFPCPACHLGSLGEVAVERGFIIGCSACPVRVQSLVQLHNWMASLQGHAVAHAQVCSGQVIFVSQEAVGNFLTCTGCDYYVGV